MVPTYCHCHQRPVRTQLQLQVFWILLRVNEEHVTFFFNHWNQGSKVSWSTRVSRSSWIQTWPNLIVRGSHNIKSTDYSQVSSVEERSVLLPAGSIPALLTRPISGLASANQNLPCRCITDIQDNFRHGANSIFLSSRGGVVLNGEACDVSNTQPPHRRKKEIRIQRSGAGKPLIIESLRLAYMG